MKRLGILLVLLLLLGTLALPAYAQEAVRFSALEIDLWPEYDRPDMLVIYRITLPADLTLPVDLQVRIPASAGEPNAVAVRQPSGGLFTIPYTRQVNGPWAVLSFTATFPEVQIEYYAPIQKQGEERTYTFTWPGDYAVDALTIQVQQPVDTTDMQITPSLGNGVPQSDGLTYYMAEVGALAAGEPFNLQIAYTKTSDTLSASNQQLQPSGPVAPPPTLWDQVQQNLPYILAGLGLLLLVIGGVWYWQSGRSEAPSRPRRRRKARRPKPPAEQDTAAEGRYCPQCGKRAQPGDRFCRTCGTPLK